MSFLWAIGGQFPGNLIQGSEISGNFRKFPSPLEISGNLEVRPLGAAEASPAASPRRPAPRPARPPVQLYSMGRGVVVLEVAAVAAVGAVALGRGGVGLVLVVGARARPVRRLGLRRRFLQVEPVARLRLLVRARDVVLVELPTEPLDVAVVRPLDFEVVPSRPR